VHSASFRNEISPFRGTMRFGGRPVRPRPTTGTARLKSVTGLSEGRTEQRPLVCGPVTDDARSSRFTAYRGWALWPMTCLRPILRESSLSDARYFVRRANDVNLNFGPIPNLRACRRGTSCAALVLAAALAERR